MFSSSSYDEDKPDTIKIHRSQQCAYSDRSNDCIWYGYRCTQCSSCHPLGITKIIEGYVQESGRSGQDGKQSTAILYYSQSDFRGYHPASEAVHGYCQNQTKCRRELLMDEFDMDGNFTKPTPSIDVL